MGKKSQMRKFKRRRQRAGFVLLSSLVLVVLGAVLFLRMDGPGGSVETAQRANVTPVQRVEAPEMAEAPRSVADAVADGDGGDAAALLAAEEEEKKTAAVKEEAWEEARARAAERERAKEERAQRAEK